MARRCICSRLLASLAEDPRLRTLPLASRMLWLLLAEAMARPGFDGVLPFSDPRRVSLLVSEAQTEVETHLETLIAERLILREGDTLVCPLLREASARTAANRRNGAGGGRPRKGETAEEMHQRRQREMILPIPGGASEKPTETERWNTPSAGAAARGPTTTENQFTDSVSRDGWQQLAKDVIAEFGLTHPRPDWTQARLWLEAGATPEQVFAVVRGIVERGTKARSELSLAYFTKAILRVAKGEAPMPQPASAPPEAPGDFERQMDAWQRNGCRGPMPVLRRAA